MRKNPAFVCALLIVVIGLSSCHRYMGSRFYPATPRFESTYPGSVELLRRQPRRSHIELGEVWIRPEPGMDRYFVENKLREKAARMGADALVITVDRYFRDRVAYRHFRRGTAIYYERQIVGVAIRYR